MHNNQKFYKVIETQVTANDQFAVLHTDYTEDQKAQAYANLYQIWASASLNAGGLQYVCGQIIEYNHEKAILLESKVFDYRESEPEPEPESESNQEA